MRFIKLIFLLATLSALSSCLKTKNDWAGLRTDKNGDIIVSIAEDEYIDQDNHVMGFGYEPFAQFDFGGADEPVKFFSVHISQPKAKKVTGTLQLKVTAANGSGDPLPAGAITIPSTVDIPAFSGTSMDVPVLFNVKKAGLDPDAYYSVVFTITSVSQGVLSANASQIEVFIHPGKYFGRYMVQTTVTDPAGVVDIFQNTKPVMLDDLAFSYGRPGSIDDPSYLSMIDEYFVGAGGGSTGLSILVDNRSNGVTAPRYALLYPTYHLNAAGVVDGVFDTRNGNNLNVTFNNDLSNKYVATNNGSRTLEVSYNATLTAPGPGGPAVNRTFKIQEKYSYHPIQVRIFY